MCHRDIVYPAALPKAAFFLLKKKETTSMIAGIKKEQHAIADYAYVPLVLAAPNLAGFKNEETAAVLVRAMAATALTYSLLTDMKGGVVKLIPYKAHLVLDLASGVLALAAPWAFGFKKNKRARNTLLAMGVTGLVVGALSLVGASKK